MVDLQIAQKCAENYPVLLHPVHGNDKILILNYILKVKITIVLKFSSKMQMILLMLNV